MFTKVIRALWGDMSQEELNKFWALSATFFVLIGSYWFMRVMKDPVFTLFVGYKYQPFAKMLSLGSQGGCMQYIISIVAALSVQSYPLLRGGEEDNEINDDEDIDEYEERKIKNRKQRKTANLAHKKWFHPLSDLLTILRAIGAYEHAVFVLGQNPKEFCEQNFLHERSMKEIHQLRLQLSEILESITDSKIEEGCTEMEADERENTNLRIQTNQDLQRSNLQPPTAKTELMLRQIITSGLTDRVATLARSQPLVLEEG